MSRKLTDQQLTYRTARISGKSATEAARAAKYKHPNKKAYLLDKKPEIRSFVEAKQGVALNHAIATRQERQEFWTRNMRDEDLEMERREHNSELLAKSEGDFTDRLEIQSPQLADLSHVSEEALLRMAGITGVPKGGYRTGLHNGNGHGTNDHANGHSQR